MRLWHLPHRSGRLTYLHHGQPAHLLLDSLSRLASSSWTASGSVHARLGERRKRAEHTRRPLACGVDAAVLAATCFPASEPSGCCCVLSCDLRAVCCMGVAGILQVQLAARSSQLQGAGTTSSRR